MYIINSLWKRVENNQREKLAIMKCGPIWKWAYAVARPIKEAVKANHRDN